MLEIQAFAKEFGIFAALFTFLLLYVLRENSKRECKYQTVIEKNQSVIEKFADIIDVKLESLEQTICDIGRSFTGASPRIRDKRGRDKNNKYTNLPLK